MLLKYKSEKKYYMFHFNRIYKNETYVILTPSINKIYTDVEIVLDDDKQQISIHVHRYVLASGSNYFLRLFTFGSNIHKNKFTL